VDEDGVDAVEDDAATLPPVRRFKAESA